MSPRSKEQFAEIRKQSYAQIVDAALELFARQGYHRTSIDEIAKLAGISKGLIYNYFKGKEDLLYQIVNAVISQGDQIVAEQAVGEEGSAAERLCAIIDNTVEMIQQDPTYWKLIMRLSMQEDIMERFEEMTKKHALKNLQQLGILLQEMGIEEAEIEAKFLAASLDGILLHYIHFGKVYPLEKIADHFKEKIRALANKSN